MTMGTAARYVPTWLVQMTIQYGGRFADPQGVPGWYMYYHEMFKNGTPRMLEVLYNPMLNCVGHVLYK